jgi:hypothetical protein
MNRLKLGRIITRKTLLEFFGRRELIRGLEHELIHWKIKKIIIIAGNFLFL